MAPPTTARRKFVTQQVGADHVGVTPRTIRNWISEGKLTGYRLPGGRAVRIDLNELDALVQRIPTLVPSQRRAAEYGPKATIVDLSNVVSPIAGWDGGDR